MTLAVSVSNDRKALYFGGSQSSLTHLQLVQNAAARLLTGGQKREHIPLLLASFHRLPEHFRGHFQIPLFVFESLYDVSPPCLSKLIHPYDQPISCSWRHRGPSGSSAAVRNCETTSMKHITQAAVHF